MRSGKTSNAGCPSGMTQLPTGQIISKQDAHDAGFEVPGYSARKHRDQAMRDLGLTKVRGSHGGIHYE